MDFDVRIIHSKEKIFEDEYMILWRVSLNILGTHTERWITEYKGEHP